MKKTVLLILVLSFALGLWSLSVYDIQFTEDASGNSAYMDQTVTVTGIVTAVGWYSGGTDSHFFICDEEGGEWSGIYVYNFDYTVELGDEVEIDATVQEYYGMTELSSLTGVTVLSTGNALPEPLEVSTGDLANTEAYEGCFVQVNDVITTQAPNNYGEAFINDGSGECQTDDAMYDFEPAVGDEYAYIRGMVDYSYDEYGLNPRTEQDLGMGGDPGFIEGVVMLDGGAGNVEDVMVTAGGTTAYPDEEGEYVMELPIGTYDVTASLAGYSSQTIADVLVEEGLTTSEIDFTLTPQGDLTIYDIQYTEDVSGDSPYAGQTVTVTGIVCADSYVGENNFFMCSDSGAWNGIFVFQDAIDVSLGDEVQVTAEVQEYYNFTELHPEGDIIILSSGNEVPEAIEVSTADLAQTEGYESILVKVSDVLVTIEPDEAYNEWYVDDGSGECQVDDGFGVIYPDIEINDEFVSITGIVDYNFEEYGLQPRFMDDFETEQNPDLVTIYDIQFTDDVSGDSPLAGQVVTVEGVVSGTGFTGDSYFISTEEGGPWSGLHIYDNANSPAMNDRVRLTGEVSEYYGFTELTNISEFEVLETGVDLPEGLIVGPADLDMEAHESIIAYVIDVDVSVLPNEYNEWYVEDWEGYECQIDDGFGVDFTEFELMVGNGFQEIHGIIDYSFSEAGLNPRTTDEIYPSMSEDENLITTNVNVSVSPNPYYANSERSGVKLSFSIAEKSNVEAAIYNIKGQKIAELANESFEMGEHELFWQAGSSASAVYFYRVVTEKSSISGKFIVIN